MAKTEVKSVDAYIAAQPRAVQGLLDCVRGAIRRAVPGGEEVISYKIPAYKLDGRPVIYFAGWKEHYSIYPATDHVVASLKDDLDPYEVSRGTIRFPLSRPVPVKLIERIARLRVQEVAGRAKATLAPTKKVKAKKRPKAGGDLPKKAGTAIHHVVYHKDGSLWAKGRVLDGMPTGYWEWFRKDGTRLRSGSFKDGRQIGEWTTYDRKGEVYKVTTMKAGTRK